MSRLLIDRNPAVAVILVIEDSDAQRATIRRAIDSCDLFDRVLEATDGISGLKLLLSEWVDVVLCDLEMPGMDGEKLLRVKDASRAGANVPFLFLTASENQRRKLRLFEGGACDAMHKPFDPPELVARLRLHLKIKQLQDQLTQKNQQLEELSTTDSLTSLRTRRFVDEHLAAECVRAKRYAAPLSVVMADFDHFKRVNDDYGHLAGDAVLREAARLLLAQLRVTDCASRFGGEEFLIVLSHVAMAGAVTAADRWRQAVEDMSVSLPDGRSVSLTLSAGVAEYGPGVDTPEALIGAADEALYRAKDAGRNRVERSLEN